MPSADIDKPWQANLACPKCQGAVQVPLVGGNFIPMQHQKLLHAQGQCVGCHGIVPVPLADLIDPANPPSA